LHAFAWVGGGFFVFSQGLGGHFRIFAWIRGAFSILKSQKWGASLKRLGTTALKRKFLPLCGKSEKDSAKIKLKNKTIIVMANKLQIDREVCFCYPF
jgi:hypothetical protein